MIDNGIDNGIGNGIYNEIYNGIDNGIISQRPVPLSSCRAGEGGWRRSARV